MRSGLVVVVALAAAHPAAAQIVTENAGVISPETPILRQALAISESEHAEEVRWIHQWIWAPDVRDELKLTIPVLWRDFELTGAGGGSRDADASGAGDLSLRYKRSLTRHDDVMESTRWSLLAEVTAPTGDDDAAHGGQEIPARLQLGAGDWTLGVGTAFTVIRDRQRAAVEAVVRGHTQHEGRELGPSLDLNLAWWYRIRPARFDPAEESAELRGVVELLSNFRDETRDAGAGLDDDGWIVWLAPGVQLYPSDRVLVEANVMLPVYQDVDDPLGDRRWAATLAIKFLF